MTDIVIKQEWHSIRASNYLGIQKNGYSTVKKNFPDAFQVYLPNTSLPNWTVIRNPMDRFVSGLAYDLRYTPYIDKTKIINNIENLIVTNYMNGPKKSNGFGCHTQMQSLYFLGEKIDFFVDISDLETFIKIHNNGIYKSEKENKTTKEEKEAALEIINSVDKTKLNA